MIGFFDIEHVKSKFIKKDSSIIDVKEFGILKKVHKPKGQSYYSCRCPYCGRLINIRAWVFASTGKMCECGAHLKEYLAVMKKK